MTASRSSVDLSQPPQGAAQDGAPSSSPQGLGSSQAQERLQREGPNSLPTAAPKSLMSIAWRAMVQPMFLLLLATAAVYAVLGNALDASMLLASVVAVGGLSVYQEHRTERVLQALKDLSTPRCTVVRDGKPLRLPSRDLVRGDRLIVDEGSRIPADATLLECNGLSVDESLLTGESQPVLKQVHADAELARLHAGTLVVQGDAVAVVTATGAHTALGRIGTSLQRLKPPTSRLQQELKSIVQVVSAMALLTCVGATVLYALREGSWTNGLLAGLTLAMSLIPEEFAVVWSVMLSLGAWRMSKLQVLVRQPQAIEALGTANVLCVDKTGTLTQNRMTLQTVHDGHAESPLPAPPEFEPLLHAASLASVTHGIEPMDRAILEAAGPSAQAPPGWLAGPRLGVGANRPYVSHWWHDATSGQAHVFVKGAAERVLALCDGSSALAQQAQLWSQSGLRVLAVARSAAPAPDMPTDGGLPSGLPLHASGLLGFADPLRSEVPAAIGQCLHAGVRVVMITGDSPMTALAVGHAAGLLQDPQASVLTGQALESLSDEELQTALTHSQVFARVSPAQKLRIVQALQQRGNVVAMTGDGVNDAPALRAADIGVAMGLRGTDVAREAAALVLLDDNFASLVDAVRMGRRVFINLRKSLGYLFAAHVPIVGVSLIPVLWGGPVLLLPLHVVLLELIIDPACSLVFEAEPEPADCMLTPPRPATEKLFSTSAALRALSAGGLALAGVLLLQWACRLLDAPDDMLRLASLGGIVAGNLLMLLWFRRPKPSAARRASNRSFHVLMLAVSLATAALFGLPGLAPAFGLPAHLPPVWALAALLIAAAFAWPIGRSLLLQRRG